MCVKESGCWFGFAPSCFGVPPSLWWCLVPWWWVGGCSLVRPAGCLGPCLVAGVCVLLGCVRSGWSVGLSRLRLVRSLLFPVLLSSSAALWRWCCRLPLSALFGVCYVLCFFCFLFARSRFLLSCRCSCCASSFVAVRCASCSVVCSCVGCGGVGVWCGLGLRGLL